MTNREWGTIQNGAPHSGKYSQKVLDLNLTTTPHNRSVRNVVRDRNKPTTDTMTIDYYPESREARDSVQ